VGCGTCGAEDVVLSDDLDGVGVGLLVERDRHRSAEDPPQVADAPLRQRVQRVGVLHAEVVFDAFDVGAFEAHLAGLGAAALTPEPGKIAATSLLGAACLARGRARRINSRLAPARVTSRLPGPESSWF